MVEATPALWRDTCERCGCGFSAGESRWIEQRRYTVHTGCAQWELWAEPPYSWKLKELRKQYRAAQPGQRARSGKSVVVLTSMREAQPMASKQLSFRIPDELWNRAVDLADRMNAQPEYVGHKVSPSRVLTMAMHAGLKPLEARYPRKRKRAKR